MFTDAEARVHWRGDNGSIGSDPLRQGSWETKVTVYMMSH